MIHFLRQLWGFDKPHRNRLAKSFAKFRTRKGVRYANEKEMLDAAKSDLPPGQIYCIGRPKNA